MWNIPFCFSFPTKNKLSWNLTNFTVGGYIYIYISTQTLCSVSALAIVVIIYITLFQAGYCEFHTNTSTLSVGSQKPLTTVGALCSWKGFLSTQIKTGSILSGFCVCFCGEFPAVLHIPSSSTLCMSQTITGIGWHPSLPTYTSLKREMGFAFSNINPEDMLRGSLLHAWMQ